MNLEAISTAAGECHLEVIGAFHPGPGDGAPAGTGTLVLLGPTARTFWPAFAASPEYPDGRRDPLDRWSARVIGALAEDLGATPLFPFGGPPFQPFIRWALASGRCHLSPIGLLVHDHAGLMVSFRGALALPARLALPESPPAPCDSCADAPCRTACPAKAFTTGGYNVSACREHSTGASGTDCREAGCLARRACPVSQRYGRLPEQSAFHMSAFLFP